MARSAEAAWPDNQRKFDQNPNMLHPYVKPGRSGRQEENISLGAHRARIKYLEDVLPGGREATYIEKPQVHVGNWWERCCQEIPDFTKSLGRRMPDNLTKCSEYREEISEYAKFFKDYAPEDVRVPVTKAATECVPASVSFRHRMTGSPLISYMSVYSRDYTTPPPFQPPYTSGLCDKKRRKWLRDILDKGVHYCSSYQENYDPEVYDQQAAPLEKAYHNMSLEREMDEISPFTEVGSDNSKTAAKYPARSSSASCRSILIENTLLDRADKTSAVVINDIEELKQSAHKYALAPTKFSG